MKPPHKQKHSGTTDRGSPEFCEFRDIPPELPAVQPWSSGLVPGRFAPLIVDVADRLQCPADYVSVALIVSASAVLGRRVGIRPKKFDDWTVVPNLWGAIVGRPGLMKSPAVAEALRFIRGLQAAASKRHDGDLEAHKIQAELLTAKRQQLKKEIRVLAKKDPAKAEALLRQQQQEECDRCEPVLERFYVNDTSVEKLGELLRENPNGLLQFRDELTGFLRRLERPENRAERSFYLEAWSGRSDYTWDRIGRGTIHVPCAVVSALGGIQPGPFHRLLTGSALDDESRDDGLVQRFQILVYPDVQRGFENVDRPANAEARTDLHRVFGRLHRVDALSLMAEKDPDEEVPFLRFAPDVQDDFDDWRIELERRIRSETEPPPIESHLAKYRSLLPSLALLYHLVDMGENIPCPVGRDAFDRAVGMIDYLETHMRRVYAPIAQPEVRAAHAIARKIRDGSLTDGFSAREVYRPQWSGLRDPDAVHAGLAVLEQCGWVRPLDIVTEARQRQTVFHVRHELLLEDPKS